MKTKALIVVMTWFATTVNTASAQDTTRYMLEGVATPAVFAAVIAKPQDRGPNAAGIMKAAGCKLLDYYVGMHNYKNYIIIECPKSVDIGPLQITLFGAGTIASGSATPIVTSAELVDVAKAAQKLSGAYSGPSK